ncbi:MAG: ATP-dependent helicase [Acidobacteria bacterium]|nr:ATP-dependent helicase [Acidobacteriota bacterium]
MSVSLNIAQRRTVEHVHGPLLVLAGAGTGKTTVLVERIVALIEKGHAAPDEILAVTFTENAAAEMRERVAQSVGPIFSSGLKACTFHGYSFNLLKEAGRDFGVVTKEDLWVYLRQRLRQLGLVHFIRANRPGKFLSDLITFFERCQDDLVDAAAYEAYVEQVADGRLPLPRVAMPKDAAGLSDEDVLARCREIARVFRRVEEMLAADKLGTFGHMISGAIALLREDHARLERERGRARFLLIDEFQDSNIAQIELAQVLAGDQRNVFAVGDPDQAIYRFRGATSAAFEEFLARFPGAEAVSLEENQRSTRAILQCAFHAIRTNPVATGSNGASPELWQRRPLESARAERARQENKPWQELPVEMVIAPDATSEAADIAESIRVRKEQLGCRWKDFAVLYRQHLHREELLNEFAARSIPVAVEGVDVLDTQPGRDVLALLRAIRSGGDAVSLLRLASLPQFGIAGEALRELLATAGKDPNLENLLERVQGGPALRQALEEARRFALDSKQKVTQVLDFAMQRFRMEVPASLLKALRCFLAEWEKKPITRTGQIGEFLQYLEHFTEAGGMVRLPAPPVEDGVRLMTAHNAKGLEFAHVFVPRVSSSSFPASYNARLFEFPHELGRTRVPAHADGKGLHLEEELRVFYVAITRARDSLTLSGRKARGRDPVPSRYLRDLAQQRALASLLWCRDAREYTVNLEAAAAAPVSAVTPWILLEPRVPLSEMPLSASAIEMYERCPLQFKIARDWNLPAEPAAPMQFGATVHTVLHDYFRAMKQGEARTREQVLEKFREEMAKGKFDDALQRELYEKQGAEQISAFLAATAAAPVPDVLDTERSFRISVKGVNVNGRVDRLDRLDGNRVRIVDYKTGRPRDQEDADESLQLSLYAMAARDAWDAEPASLVFYNLETNAPVETFRNPAQLLEASEKVREVAGRIAAGDFTPKPDYHCTWCPYRSLCPVKEQRFYTIGSPTTSGVQ